MPGCMEQHILTASCLCGEVRWEVDGPLGDEAARATTPTVSLLVMSHCYCSRCRKAHGAACGTYILVREERFRLTHGRESVVSHASSPGITRPFCGRCGSVVPDGVPWKGRVSMPAGNFDGDPGVRARSHIFASSRAPWTEIRDDLPRFDGYPDGVAATPVPERAPLDPPGAPRGSCLCGQITYVIEAPALRSRTCHCGRCRKAGSAASLSYLTLPAGGVRFTRGEELLVAYKVPEARYFGHVFCRVCGSSMPRRDSERQLVFIPMGSLDDDPGTYPAMHIFVASKAPWDTIDDDLPQHDEYPPS